MQRLGQHFLKNKSILQKIARAALENARKDGVTRIIEIGGGHGELTRMIADDAVEVTVVEKDVRLAQGLQSEFGDKKNIRIVLGDVRTLLSSVVSELKTPTYSLVGNIPYYLTSYLFRIIGELPVRPRSSIFLIQKEVAERVAGDPGRMNKLAAAVQIWADVSIVGHVGRGEFSPPPQVDSAIVRLVAHERLGGANEASYYKTVSALFRQPRKTILNNMRAEHPDAPVSQLEMQLWEAGIDPALRPQDLSVEDIIRLSVDSFVQRPKS